MWVLVPILLLAAAFSAADAANETIAECRWKTVEGKRNSGNEVQTLSLTTLEDCKAAVEADADKTFKSIEFNKATNTCYLQKVDRNKIRLTVTDVNYIYAEYDCEGTYPDQCQWEGPIQGHYIGGTTIVTLAAYSQDMCKEACEQEETFNCRAFDYIHSSVTCYLKIGSRFGSKLTASVSYEYYERNCDNRFRGCSQAELEDTDWLTPRHGYYMNSGTLQTLTKATVKECKQTCLAKTDFHCLGFDYDNAKEQCILKSGSTELGNYLITSASVDYYQLTGCPYAEPKKVPAKDCRWEKAIQGYINGNDMKKLIGMSFEQCKRMCEREDDFVCLSIDYTETSKTCYLQKIDRHDAALTASTNNIYSERDCDSHYIEKCKWEGPYADRYVSGYDQKTLTGIEDIQTCKEACEQETSFDCVSFDYLRTHKYCYLQRVTLYDVKLSVSTSYEYYERNCYDEYRACSPKSPVEWSEKKAGRYLAANDLRSLPHKTLEECKLSCLQSTEFHCISLDYRRKDQYCYLQGKSTESVQLTQHGDYDYYEIIKCTGNKTAAPMPGDDDVADHTCIWVGPYTGKYMSSNDWKTLTGVDLAECKTACEEYDGCKGFDHYVAARYCYLNKNNRHGQVLSSSAAYNYYELECDNDPFPDECVWQKGIKSKYIHSHDQKVLYDLDVPECKAACEETDDFHCKSFDYLIANRRCYLSMKNRYGVALSASASYTYYERDCNPALRTCSREADATWLGPWHGKYINANMRTMNTITVAECKEACLTATEFHCTGFYMYPAADNCYLLASNRAMGGVILENVNYDYYEIASCDGPETEGEKSKDCKWQTVQTGKYLSGFDKITLSNVDVAGCKSYCEDVTAFDCKSFDTYSIYCYLQDKDRGAKMLASHASYNYYEMDCDDEFPKECVWLPVIHRGYISGNDLRTVITSDIAECKKACEDEKEFHCVSFDFYRASERCYLQVVNRYSSLALTTHDSYDYYERDCKPKVRECKDGADATWVGPIIGYGISSHDMRTLNDMDIEECKEACLQQTTFNCLSFDYTRNTRSCKLQTQRREDVPLTLAAAQTVYYEIESCKLNADSATTTGDAELKFEWMDVLKSYYLAGNDKKTLNNYGIDDCKEACENEKSFKCKSFDYLPAYQRCYLQEANRQSFVLTASASYYYYEIDYEDDYPEECEWQDVQVRSYLGGYKKTLKTMSVDQCKEACEQEITFDCISFDYYVATVTCYLNQQDKFSKKLAVNAAYNYYERNCNSKIRHCGEDSLVAWSDVHHGLYFSGYLKTLAYMQVDECKIACLQETEFHCRAFSYNRKSDTCYLAAGVRGTSKLAQHTDIDYYEILECKTTDRKKRDATDELEASVAANGCKWSGTINNYYISGQDKKTLTGKMPGDCMKACEEETTFICKSFDYRYDTRTCYLSDKNRFDVKLTLSGSYQFYELSCDATFPAECQWEHVSGSYISGYDWASITSVSSAATCRELCESECAFHCMSVDYIPSSNTCKLNYVNRYTVALAQSTSYEFYERNCINTFKACSGESDADWEGPFYGKGLTGFTNLKTINKLTVDQCKTACQQAVAFHCRSFRWLRSSGTCYLTSLSSDSKTVITDLNYNLYELKGCDGELPPMDDAEPAECIPEDFYVASCACSGDPHCLSFDGQWLHFQGNCWYTSARDNCENGMPTKDPTWEIIQNNDGSGVSYVRGVQINLYDYDMEISLKAARVTVNGVAVLGSPMRYFDGKIQITLGGTIIVTVKGSIQVKYSSNAYFWVGILATMREKTCGICGNFDGSKANDWVIGNSKHCMGKYPNAVPGEITTDTNIMGTSWTAKMDTQEAACVNNCPYPPPPVGCDVENGIKAEEHCDILQNTVKSFKTCLAKLSETQRTEIFDNCVFDACSVDNYEDIVCRHAASLAKICVDQFNIKVSWRSGSFCPMVCEGDFMEYQSCGDPCYPTCSDRAGENCGDLGPCTEGCYCKKGYVFDGHTDCIAESSCGCEVPALGGIYINVGDSYKANDCSESCTCEEAGADLVCEDMTCSENFVCGAKGGEPACLCEPPFILEDGACIELPYPCEETETLKCFTCDTLTDDDCTEFGLLKFCDAEEAICSYEVTKNAMAAVTKVTRGCVSKDSCLPDSIGLGIEYCQEGLGGEQVCKRCNYGDTDKTDAGDIPTADCAVAAVPTTPAPEDPCVKPVDQGEGTGKAKHFYYSADEETCLKFTYKGSKGNSNNFETKEACMAACGAEAPDTCNLPVDKGDGTGKTSKRFYWSAKKNVCKSFKYTGSGGNLNNFLNKKTCQKECGGK